MGTSVRCPVLVTTLGQELCITLPGYATEKFDIPMPKMIWKSQPGYPMVQIRSHAINVVQNSRVQANVALSAHIGASLAMKSDRIMPGWLVQHKSEIHWTGEGTRPAWNQDGVDWSYRDGRTVMYINTYAGPRFMQWACRHVLEIAAREDPTASLTVKGPMIMMDCPMGGWKEFFTSIKKTVEFNGIDTLILNSFEFAGLTSYERQLIARQLIELNRYYDTTIVVFTTDMRENLKAGEMRRGPIGTLAAVAESVWRVPPPNYEEGPHPFYTDFYEGTEESRLIAPELLEQSERLKPEPVHEKPIQKSEEAAEIKPESAPEPLPLAQPKPLPVMNKMLRMGAMPVVKSFGAACMY